MAQALSLDVLFGIACGGLLAQSTARVRMSAAWWIALPSAVWAIYTADHLLDARNGPASLRTYRHQFHRRHARALTTALVVVLALAAVAATRLPPLIAEFGILMACSAVIYLASAQGILLPRLPKEPTAGVLYAIGLWGGPLLLSPGRLTLVLLAAGLHAGAAVLNLATYGLFEIQADRHHSSRSLALAWGADQVRRAVLLAGGIGVAISGCAMVGAPRAEASAFAVLAVMAATPPLMLLGRRWFGQRQRYRIWGDVVFLLGAVPWLLGKLVA